MISFNLSIEDYAKGKYSFYLQCYQNVSELRLIHYYSKRLLSTFPSTNICRKPRVSSVQISIFGSEQQICRIYLSEKNEEGRDYLFETIAVIEDVNFEIQGGPGGRHGKINQ